MRTTRFGIILAAALAPVASSTAQDAHFTDLRKTDVPKGTGPADAAAAVADPSASVLRNALGAIKSMDAEIPKPAPGPGPTFGFPISPMIKARAFLAVGTAQAAIGDLTAARETLRTAADLAGTLEGIEERAVYADLLVTAQAAVGNREGARNVLRNAADAARLVETNREPSMFGDDPAQDKPLALGIIAAAQARAGDTSASRITYADAIKTAEALKDFRRLFVLAGIARAQTSRDAVETWKQATDFAHSLKGEAEQADAFQIIVRNYCRLGRSEELLRLVRDEVTGDLRGYLLWTASDELTHVEKRPSAQALTQLAAIAQQTQFGDRFKKTAVFLRIADAQAGLGDAEGAYKSFDAVQSARPELTFLALQARVRLMREVARGQLEAGSKEAARQTVQAALEIVQPYLQEDANFLFPLADLAESRAKAGDPQGALAMAESIRSPVRKIDVIAAAAVAQGKDGDRAVALATLEKAHEALKLIANASVWETTESPFDLGIPIVHYAGRPERAYASRHPDSPRLTDLRPAALSSIALAHASLGDFERALKTASQIAASGDFPTGAEKMHVFCTIAKAQADGKDFLGARRAFEVVVDESPMTGNTGERDDTLIAIAAAQANAGDAKGALGWAMEQPTPERKLMAIQGLAEGITALKSPKR